MKNHICNYENSKELKELGMNEDCIFGYNSYNQLKHNLASVNGHSDYIRVDKKYYTNINAPLHSRAIDFLLEKLEDNPDFSYGVTQRKDTLLLNKYPTFKFEKFTTKDELIAHMIKLVKNG